MLVELTCVHGCPCASHRSRRVVVVCDISAVNIRVKRAHVAPELYVARG